VKLNAAHVHAKAPDPQITHVLVPCSCGRRTCPGVRWRVRLDPGREFKADGRVGLRVDGPPKPSPRDRVCPTCGKPR
jgi:hypothetical protein